jgi:hypothetical protein
VNDPTAAYHGGDANSVAAAKRARHSRAERLDRIVAHLLAAGPRGRTSEELQRETEISHQSMGGLIIQLIKEKRIHRPGGDAHRRKTSTGAWAWICYAGPGKNVGRPPRTEKEAAYAALLQRFADALEKCDLGGPARGMAISALKKHGFRGRA